MDFIDTVIGHPQDRLVDWITIHPRTRHMPSTMPIRNEALEILIAKYAGTLPILLSGDIFDLNTLPINPTSTNTTSQVLDIATLTLKDDNNLTTPKKK